MTKYEIKWDIITNKITNNKYDFLDLLLQYSNQ